MLVIMSIQVNPRCYKCEVTSYYLTPGSFQPQLWYNFIDNFVDSERMFTEAVEAADDADKL